MRKTHSQDIALFFFVVDCLFLVPLLPLAVCTFPFLFIIAVLSIMGLFTKEFAISFTFLTFIFILFSIVGFGIYLLTGYFKHYKNYLNRREVDRLWIKTIIYNSLFFFPAFYIKLQCWFTEKCLLEYRFNNELGLLTEYPSIFSFLTLWWFLAIFMAFSALASMGETTGTDDVSPKLNIS